MAKSRKLPLLDFAPSPDQYRTATNGNGNGHNGSWSKPAPGLDLSPRLVLSLQCEVECESLEGIGAGRTADEVLDELEREGPSAAKEAAEKVRSRSFWTHCGCKASRS